MENTTKLNAQVDCKYDQSKGRFEIKNFEELKATCDKFIESNSLFLDIKDINDLKYCKEERRDLNLALKQVQQVRKQLTSYLLGDFTNSCKTLEKALKTASEAHSETIKRLTNTSDEKEQEKAFIVIYSEDKEVLKKISKYAKKYKATVSEDMR